jgi:hypothetical protein
MVNGGYGPTKLKERKGKGEASSSLSLSRCCWWDRFEEVMILPPEGKSYTEKDRTLTILL